MITRKGLSGLDVQIDTNHPLAGTQVTITDDGQLTGLTVRVLGHIPRNYYNTMAIQLPGGRVTAKSPKQLGLTTTCPLCGAGVDEYRVIHEPAIKRWPDEPGRRVVCREGQWVHAKIGGEDVLFRMSAHIE